MDLSTCVPRESHTLARLDPHTPGKFNKARGVRCLARPTFQSYEHHEHGHAFTQNVGVHGFGNPRMRWKPWVCIMNDSFGSE